MMFYGLIAIAVQPALILGVVVTQMIFLWVFWWPGLLVINICFGVVSIAQGFVAYQIWQTFGVIRPRARAMQMAREPNVSFN